MPGVRQAATRIATSHASTALLDATQHDGTDIAARCGMAETKTKGRGRSRTHRTRHRSRRRARARRTPGTRIQREFSSARMNLDAAASEARRAGERVGAAGEDVLQAGQAGLEAVRRVATSAAGRASEAASDAAETTRKRLGAAAVDATRTVVSLPEMVRDSARRGVELVESASARAVVSVIHAGTKALHVAAEYVNELAPRRRVDRRALRELVVEQLRWAHAGSEAYDRAVDDSDDMRLRMQLVRCKLETIKEAETLRDLLHAVGGNVPSEERTPPPTVPGEDGPRTRGPAAARQGLAHALTIATQSAEGWRVLGRIALAAEPTRSPRRSPAQAPRSGRRRRITSRSCARHSSRRPSSSF
jgi:hypothetical protein